MDASRRRMLIKELVLSLAAIGLLFMGTAQAKGGHHHRHNYCFGLPLFYEVEAKLANVVENDSNGLNNHVWATLVNRDGVVCIVTRSGSHRGDQFPGSRVVSAQKANTANAFSLPGFSLSTANLFSAVQPGGSLFGLQESNPVDTIAAYGGSSRRYGLRHDPMVGHKIGGVNVFGGGLALYDENGSLLGALGISGDTSCRDHILAWKLRDALGLDYVPAGFSSTGDDNMIQDIVVDPVTGMGVSASGFGHPLCGFGEEAVISNLPSDFPTGSAVTP